MQDILGDRHIALCREITKKHEEIIRGKISEIISITAELKGEMVIVVSGNNDNDEVNLSPEILITEVDNYVNKGMSVKDAIKEVSKLRKVNKNELYALYHSQNDLYRHFLVIKFLNVSRETFNNFCISIFCRLI